MIEQGNKTEQLIYRTSYRKHRERLADIRHNITANEFQSSKNPQSTRKHLNKQKLRKEEIEAENNFIKTKMNAIKHRGNSKIEEFFATEQLRKQPKRYFNDFNDAKIQVISEFVDGDNIKFVLPSRKNSSFSNNVRSKDAPKVDISIVNKDLPINRKYTSYSLLKDSQKERESKQKQVMYHLPERNQNRVVIYKKTLILSSMQSCLLQLSLINERLLIVAYMMGFDSSTLRELLPLKRTNDILREYNGNYEDLCNRIVIEKGNEKYQAIRISLKEDNKEIIITEQEKNKQKAKIQVDFLKRNYYTLAKSQEESKVQSQKEKLPIVSNEHVQAIVQRLAAPKRLYKFREEKLDKIQKQQRVISSYEKDANRHQLNEQFRTDKKNSIYKNLQSQESIKKQSQATINISQQKQKVKLQVTAQKAKVIQNEPINQSAVSSLKKTIPKEKEESKVSEEEKYEDEQFDNPSQLKTNKNSLQKAKLRNDSAISNKSNHSRIMKQSQKISHKNQSEIYETEFENQPEKEQSNANQIENSNLHSVNPPVENVEQQYEDEFSN